MSVDRTAGQNEERERALNLEGDEAAAAVQAIPEADVPDPLIRLQIAVKALRAARDLSSVESEPPEEEAEGA